MIFLVVLLPLLLLGLWSLCRSSALREQAFTATRKQRRAWEQERAIFQFRGRR